MKLTTTDKQLHHLQHAVNESRQSSTKVSVDKASLRNLLLDHHQLNGALARAGKPVALDTGAEHDNA